MKRPKGNEKQYLDQDGYTDNNLLVKGLNRYIDHLESQEDKEQSDFIHLPKALTAENGAKALLIGEFKEHYEIDTYDDNGDDVNYIIEVPVSWTTIKDIYKKVVEHYGIQKAISNSQDPKPFYCQKDLVIGGKKCNTQCEYCKED